MHSPRPFRYTISVCGVGVLVGAVFAAVRLSPLVFQQHVAWRTVGPLWFAAIAAVLEAALLIGTPMGASLGIKCARAANGKSAGSSGGTAAQLGSGLRFLAIWLILTATVAAYVNSRFGAPGNVVRDVIAGARDDCIMRGANATVAVPLIGARWQCSPSEAPRLVGEFARRATSVKFAARGIELGQDLASVRLSHLEVSAAAVGGMPSAHLSVESARLRGAWPWARPARLSGVVRAIYVASVAAMLGVLTIVFSGRRRVTARFVGVASAGLGGTVGWLLLRSVDAHEQWGMYAYALIPPAAALCMGMASWVVTPTYAIVHQTWTYASRRFLGRQSTGVDNRLARDSRSKTG